MLSLIDIAGRTGQAPVRALLGVAIGTTDPAELLPHEIRYRNDQHHVIYGLYDGDRILGLIGLARNPAHDDIEIRHVAALPSEPDAVIELLQQVLGRQSCAVVHWRVPATFEDAVRDVGFRPDTVAGDDRTWMLRTR